MSRNLLEGKSLQKENKFHLVAGICGYSQRVCSWGSIFRHVNANGKKEWPSAFWHWVPPKITLNWQDGWLSTIFLSVWSSLHLSQYYAFAQKRATSFSDCFMPSWCIACDCFPASHSLKFASVYPYGVSYACPACRLHMLYHFTLGDLPKCLRENETKVVAFNQKRVDRQRILDSQNQLKQTWEVN